jgi:hypothetical protein
MTWYLAIPFAFLILAFVLRMPIGSACRRLDSVLPARGSVSARW